MNILTKTLFLSIMLMQGYALYSNDDKRLYWDAKKQLTLEGTKTGCLKGAKAAFIGTLPFLAARDLRTRLLTPLLSAAFGGSVGGVTGGFVGFRSKNIEQARDKAAVAGTMSGVMCAGFVYATAAVGAAFEATIGTLLSR